MQFLIFTPKTSLYETRPKITSLWKILPVSHAGYQSENWQKIKVVFKGKPNFHHTAFCTLISFGNRTFTCTSRPVPVFSGEHDKNPYFEVHANLFPVCFKLSSMHALQQLAVSSKSFKDVELPSWLSNVKFQMIKVIYKNAALSVCSEPNKAPPRPVTW